MESVGDDGKSSLQVATPDELDGLLDKLQRHLPESTVIQGALLTRKAFKRISEIYQTKIYHESNSSLVVVTPITSKKGIQTMTVFWDTNVEADEEIIRLLRTIPEIDWTQSIFFYATPLIILEKIQKMVERRAIGGGFLCPYKVNIGYLYAIKSLSSDEPRLPDGFELRPLMDEHIEFVSSHWKYNFSETIEAYKHLISVVPAIGIFKNHENNTINQSNTNATALTNLEEDSHVDGGVSEKSKKRDSNKVNNPVAWTHLSQFNTLTNTFTTEEHRGRKFGTTVTHATVKRSLQETGTVSAIIEGENLVSIKMHEKIGFVKQYALGYQYYKSLKTDSVVDKSTKLS